MFKSLVQKKLEAYVKKYFKKNPDIKLVVVTGSVGKTSTKIAVATVLSEAFRVRLHEGNHNSEVSAPLAILGIDFPDSLTNVGEWLKVFSAARARINNPTDVDVIVQELGTDGIGQVPHFGTYLSPDIAVVTAVSAEHMEFFQSIDNVAKEELAAANFSKQAFINKDDIDGRFATYITNQNISTYGTSGSAEYHYLDEDFSLEKGHVGDFIAPEWSEPVPAQINVLGEHNLRPAVAAAAVGVRLGMNQSQISSGLSKVHAVVGRMNVLRGSGGTTIIDDSYNSSPLAAASALKTLYSLSVPQRIAVLGSMNELGATAQIEHEAIGNLCDPNQLAWVITVGDDAEKWLAPAARAKGCQVKSFKSSIDAGGFVNGVKESGAAILFKGSQGNVYLEEGIKVVLHSTDEEKQLVRQSDTWLKKKNEYFNNLA